MTILGTRLNIIQPELNRKADMEKIKTYVMITLGALAFLLITGIAKADGTATPKTVIDTLASVPGKLHGHIQMEIAKTKEFQKKSWAKSKTQFANLKKLFIKD